LREVKFERFYFICFKNLWEITRNKIEQYLERKKKWSLLMKPSHISQTLGLFKPLRIFGPWVKL
jgi:hypothetical protein